MEKFVFGNTLREEEFNKLCEKNKYQKCVEEIESRKNNPFTEQDLINIINDGDFTEKGLRPVGHHPIKIQHGSLSRLHSVQK